MTRPVCVSSTEKINVVVCPWSSEELSLVLPLAWCLCFSWDRDNFPRSSCCVLDLVQEEC